MLTSQQVERHLQSLPKEATGEDHRAACCIVYGVRDGRSLKEIKSYYSLSEEMAVKWWDYFNFGEIAKVDKKKRGSKTNVLDAYIKDNIGKILTSNSIIESCQISTPTLYNYINANRGYFHRVARGTYKITDPVEERAKDKS